ncbi:MAG: histidine phosphatase family protein [Planctomycetota bacterium]|jgi:probable phosphoglycerate mutase
MKTVFLVQHAQSQHHVNRQARLWPDVRNGLTEHGQRQAEALAARLRADIGERPCQVYASPMQRAAETAGIVARQLDVTPVSVHDLHEYNGRFAMERTSDGRERAVDESAWSLFDQRPFPEAETWREFHARVAAAMDELKPRVHDDSLPVLVVHGGTLSNIVLWWLGLPLDALPERTSFAASPGSLSVLETNRFGKPVVERLNDRAHLASLE